MRAREALAKSEELLKMTKEQSPEQIAREIVREYAEVSHYEQADTAIHNSLGLKMLIKKALDAKDAVAQSERAKVERLREALKLCNAKLNKAGVRCSLAEKALKGLYD